MAELVKIKQIPFRGRRTQYETTFADKLAMLSVEWPAFSEVEMITDDFANGENLLAEEELDILMDVMLLAMRACKEVPMFGSFALYSQMEGEEAICNLRANLKNGPNSGADWNLDGNGTVMSNVAVTRMIKAVLDYAELVELKRKVPTFLPTLKPGDDTYLESKIYQSVGEAVLVFNTDLGRFVASYSDGDLSNGTWMLALVAQTLACLRQDDAMAQESAGLVRNALLPGPNGVERQLMDAIELVFRQKEDPIVQGWQRWLHRMNDRVE